MARLEAARAALLEACRAANRQHDAFDEQYVRLVLAHPLVAEFTDAELLSATMRLAMVQLRAQAKRRRT